MDFTHAQDRPAAHAALLEPGAALTPAQVYDTACHGARIGVSAGARAAVGSCRAALERTLDDGLPHYGINTGFGSLANQRINREDLATLQRNLIRSHAAGVGAALPVETVRATMAVLAASLARGRSGVRPELLDHLVAVINAGITPVVPESGSGGPSGPLAPVANIAQVRIGSG